MEKYFKRIVEPSKSPNGETSTKKQCCAEFDPNDVVSDPGLRKQVEEFDVSVRARIREEYLRRGPCQPFGHTFPPRKFGKENRSFQAGWFVRFPWLEYSVSKDAAYCFWCYLFKTSSVGCQGGHGAFTSAGMSDWKNAIDKFKIHVGRVGSAHYKAINHLQVFRKERESLSQRFENGEVGNCESQTFEDGMEVGDCESLTFENGKEVGNCESQASEDGMEVGSCEPRTFVYGKEVVSRNSLTAVLDVIRFLLKQGLPFGGHSESDDPWNEDQFFALLKWHKLHISKEPFGNDQMISPSVPRDMISSCAAEIRNVIRDDIGDSVYSLLVDEPIFDTGKEPLGLILRYVNKQGHVVERLFASVDVFSCETILKNVIDELFAKHKLSLLKMRGQGHSGACSCMQDELSGLRDIILKANPLARHIHCFAQDFQSVVVANAWNINVVESLMYANIIIDITGNSYKREDEVKNLEHEKLLDSFERGDNVICCKEKNEDVCPEGPRHTRWGSYFRTISHLLSMWTSVLQMLDNVWEAEEEARGKLRYRALSMIEEMEKYRFVFAMHLMKCMLSITNELSLVLQQKDRSIVLVVDLIRTVKTQLQTFRYGGLESLLHEVNTFCELHMIPVANMEESMKTPRYIRNRGPTTIIFDHYHEIFCEVVDRMIQEMNNRFSEEIIELLPCIACLHPKDSFSQFDIRKLLQFAELYPEDFSVTDRVMLEPQLQTFIYDMRADGELSAIQDLESLAKKMVQTGRNVVFPLVYRLLELALVLPISAATVKRDFSEIRTIKAEFCSKMGGEWLNDSLVVHIENELLATVEDEQILQRFQQMQFSSPSDMG